MIKRLALRTMLFASLTILAFLVMQPLTIWTGWPELMQGLKAAAILSWGELTVLWIRVCVSPRLDSQALAKEVETSYDARGMAIVYAAYTFTWAVRLVLFVVIGWIL